MTKRSAKMCETEEMLEAAEVIELPDLPPQQIAFVLCVCDGDSPYEAYLKSYDTKGGQTARIEAWRLMRNPKIAQWLDCAKKMALAQCAKTLESHIADLERLKTMALSDGNYGAAVQAAIHQGKAQGHYVEQTRDMTDRDDEAVLERARALFGPDIERAFKEQLSGKPTNH